MEKRNSFYFIYIFLTTIILSVPCLSQEARFTKPNKGETIMNRQDFSVAVEIDDFDLSDGYYWTAIASVKSVNRDDRNRILFLRDQIRSEDNTVLQNEMEELLSKWEIDLFWPKFYIREELYEGNVYDGGVNPTSEPQAMILLLLKVDNKLNNYFNEWFAEGPVTRYPGIPVSALEEGLILARCEIFFP